MHIVLISDVHEQWQHLAIPKCDVLVSCGDYSYLGKPKIVESFHKWLSNQPAERIISVQGNHELWVEKNFTEARAIVKAICPRIKFIAKGSFVLDGVKFYCSAVQPEFCNWAWNMQRGKKIKAHWAQIPDDVEVLITHGPAYGILDQTRPDTSEHLGCRDLRLRLIELKKLRLHGFGHIHGSSGIQFNKTLHPSVTFINASVCDETYKPVNPPRQYWLL